MLGGEANSTGLCCVLGSAELVERGTGDPEQAQPLEGGSGAEKLAKKLWTWLKMGNGLSGANWLGEAHPSPLHQGLSWSPVTPPAYNPVALRTCIYHPGQFSALLQLEKTHSCHLCAAQVEIGIGEGIPMVTLLDQIPCPWPLLSRCRSPRSHPDAGGITQAAPALGLEEEQQGQ